MAVNVISRPNLIAPAYRPMLYTMGSTLSPNGIAAEKSTYTGITVAEAGDPIVTGGFGIFPCDVVLFYTVAPADVTWLFKGGRIEVQDGPYEGNYTIRHIAVNGGTTAVVIDADDLGDYNTPGTFGRHYPNYNIKINLKSSDIAAIDDVFRIKIDPLNFNRFTADVSGFITKYLENRIESKQSVQAYQSTTSTPTYFIEYAEEYDQVNADGTVDRFEGTPVVDSQTGRAVNASPPVIANLDGEDISLAQGFWNQRFVLTNSSTASQSWLTTMPSNIRVTPDQTMACGFIWDGTASAIEYRVDRYSSTGASLGSIIGTLSGSFVNDKAWYLQVAPLNLWGSDAGVAYYDFRLVDDATTTIDRIRPLRITIDKKCYNNQRTFYFDNDYGGSDSYNFRGEESQSLKVSRTIKQSDFGSSFPNSSGPYSGQASDFSSVFTDKERVFTANSGLVNEETAIWLSNLISSNNVYTEIVAFAGTPYNKVIILPGSFSVVKSQERLFNVSFKWKYAYLERTVNG